MLGLNSDLQRLVKNIPYRNTEYSGTTDQMDSEERKVPGPDGNEINKQRRPSIELKKLDPVDSKDQNNPRPEVIYKSDKEPETWMFCLKCSLILLNTFIWILGVAIVGIGIWMVVDKEFWTLQFNLDVTMLRTGIYVGIAAGVIIVVIGLVGCIGAWKQSSGLLITFGIIILVIVLLEAAAMAIVWATSNNSDLQEKLTQYIKDGINRRYEDDRFRQFVDLLQAKLQCCGVDDDEEFGENNRYPESCNDETTGLAYKQGCLTAAVKYLKSKAGILGGVAASMFALQVAILSLTVCMVCGLRQAQKNIF